MPSRVVGCEVNVGRQLFQTQIFHERAVTEENALAVQGAFLTRAVAVFF